MNTKQHPAEDVISGFRSAMRKFPATVTIVTANDGVTDHGMTVTAVTSVSMEPPSIMVCLNNRTRVHEMLLGQKFFAVNVLRREHGILSDAFSGKVPPEKRFELSTWRRHASGVLQLMDAHSSVVCRRVAALPFGTHTIFIGEVLTADVDMDTGSQPLLYENGQYCTSFLAG